MKNRIRLLVLAGVLCAVSAAPVSAQSFVDPLITDRPDITESSQVVDLATLQIETSVQWRRTEYAAADTKTFNTPTLFRFGVGRGFELRLSSDAYSVTSESGPIGDPVETSGFGPLIIGAKYHFAEPGEGSRMPSMGVLAFSEIPSGSSVFRIRNIAAGLIVAADGDLSERFSWGANGGLTAIDVDTPEVSWGGSVSAALGFGFSNRVGGFVEVAFAGIGLPEADRLAVADTGVTFLLSPNAQLDVALGAGLTEQTEPDFFATLGFSFRASFL
jgi:hypothetical protein